jgi:hypothetical protein
MKTRFAATVVAALSTFALSLHAENDPNTIAAAREVGIEGLKLAASGNCKDAIEKLEHAEKLHHAPTTQFKLGECQIKLGHLLAGTDQLRQLTGETLDPKASPAFVKAQENAKTLLEETVPRIATLHVNVALPPGVQPQVSIDGEVIPPDLLATDRPIDPGRHTVDGIAPGHKKTTQQVLLREGEKVTVNLTPEVERPTPAPSR